MPSKILYNSIIKDLTAYILNEIKPGFQQKIFVTRDVILEDKSKCSLLDLINTSSTHEKSHWRAVIEIIAGHNSSADPKACPNVP